MGYRPEVRTQFFYLDSEDPSSPDYSPPGQLFPDTRTKDIDNYLKGEPYTDGPYQDTWGQWVSGYVPLKDTEGTVVGMIGIDVATSVWHAQKNFLYGAVGTIILLLCAVIILVARMLYRKQLSIETLKMQNRTLEHNESKLRTMQNMAQLGSIVFYFPRQTVTIDQQFTSLFAGKTDNLDFADFLSYIHPDDVAKAQAALDEIRTSDVLYSWFDIRIGTLTNGYHAYHIYGNVERDSSGAANRYSAIMQDVTDIAK